MDISDKEAKKRLIKKYTPKSPHLKNITLAFIFGGLISALGEGLFLVFSSFLEKTVSLTLVSVSIIFLASLLTALGVFDRIARHAGAGTLVPITGFSNAVTSQAIDGKNEGFVLGVGAKIFTVAGPVILFGLSAGIVYGVIYYLVNLLLPYL